MVTPWNIFRLRTAAILGLMTVLVSVFSVRADDARLLRKSELKSLIANARTAQDHVASPIHAPQGAFIRGFQPGGLR